MTLEQAVSLGRAWVEAGWTWALGQVAIVHHPTLTNVGVVVQVADARPLRIVYDNRAECWLLARAGSPGPMVPPGMSMASTADEPSSFTIVPDFRDPGTRGHALDQVLVSRGPECVYDLDVDTRLSGGWCAELSLWDSVLSSDDERFGADGETRAESEARVLLAARRAAP